VWVGANKTPRWKFDARADGCRVGRDSARANSGATGRPIVDRARGDQVLVCSPLSQKDNHHEARNNHRPAAAHGQSGPHGIAMRPLSCGHRVQALWVPRGSSANCARYQQGVQLLHAAPDARAVRGAPARPGGLSRSISRRQRPSDPGAGSVFALLQAIIGFQPHGEEGVLYLDPWLPSWLPDLTPRDLRVGDQTFDLRIQGVNGDSQVDVLRGDPERIRRRSFALASELLSRRSGGGMQSGEV
jgi:hypothetical protein